MPTTSQKSSSTTESSTKTTSAGTKPTSKKAVAGSDATKPTSKPTSKKAPAEKKAKAKSTAKKEEYASKKSHSSLSARVKKLEDWVANAESVIGNRGGIDIRLLDPEVPQQPQEHEDEMISTAPMPVEKAAELADETVPPHYDEPAA